MSLAQVLIPISDDVLALLCEKKRPGEPLAAALERSLRDCLADPMTAQTASAHDAQPSSNAWAVSLFGEKHHARLFRDALPWVLQRLQERDGTFLPRLNQHGGPKRKIVAKSPEELYPGTPRLVERREWRPVATGWYVDLNRSNERIFQTLCIACGVAGIEFGTDLEVNYEFVGITPLSDEEL